MPPAVTVPMVRDVDAAWAAGFIDGEGSFVANPTGKRRYLKIRVPQKDRALLDRLVGIFGLGDIYLEARRDIHHWSCSGSRAFHVACQVWPYLGEQKKTDFKRALRRIRETRHDLGHTQSHTQVVVQREGETHADQPR